MRTTSFRRVAGMPLALLILVGAALSRPAPTVVQHLLNFDELAASYVFNAAHQPYADLGGGRGVIFESNGRPTVTAWADARSAPNVLKNVPALGSEFGSADEKICLTLTGFTSHSVRVYVGMDERAPLPVVASMYAYRTDGGYRDLVGSATVNLGNGPTPCYHELKVETTAGSANHGTIGCVEITYGAAFAPEILDAVLVKVYDGTVAAPPADTTPPVVEITDVSPEGTTEHPSRTSVFFVGGTVEEDRGLLYLQAWHDGHLDGPITPIPIPGTNTYLFSAPIRIGDTEGTHSLQVRAVDFDGNDDRDSIDVEYLPPDPPPPSYPDTLDFRARALEPTQAIQGWEKLGITPPGPSHTTTLVRGKTTLVRVYATLLSTDENIPGVPCLLRAYRGGVEMEGSPIYALNELTLNRFETLAWQRESTDRSFNFILPSNWTTAGTTRLEATVNAWNHIPEKPGGYDAYNSVIQEVVFHEADCRMTVHVYKVRSASEGNVEPTWADCTRNIVRTRQIYPVPPDMISVLNTGVATTHEVISTGDDDNLSAFLHGLHYALGFRHCQPPTWNCGSVWLALMHPSFLNRGITDADFPVCISVASDSEFYRMTTAHEIGHAYGLGHVQGCDDPAGPYEPYPAYRDQDGTLLPEASIGDWGVQIEPDNSLSLKDPDDYGALMSYCGDTWMSVYSWNWLRGYFGATLRQDRSPERPSPCTTAPPAAPSDNAGAPPAPYLYVSGLVQGGKAILDPAWQGLLPAGSSDQQGTGNCKLRLLDGQGATLFERQFDVAPIIDMKGRGLFTQVLPAKSGTQTILLEGSFGESIKIQAGPKAPTVRVLSPNGGESWNGTGFQTITWTGGDSDGDPLTYAVLFSPDNGTTWQMLSSDERRSYYTVDLSTLPEGLKSSLVKVQATDGINTAEDVSDLVFSKAGQAPQASIASPSALTIFSQNDTVVFDGVVSDIDEPAFPAAHMSWTSSRHGLLGTGPSLAVRNLAAGLHEIEFRAEDNRLNTGSDTTYIFIRPADGQLTPGDLNLDTRVNALDLVVMIHFLAGNVTPGQYPFAASAGAADLDGAPGADALDLVNLLRMTIQQN